MGKKIKTSEVFIKRSFFIVQLNYDLSNISVILLDMLLQISPCLS